MADKARNETDKELKRMEKEIRKIYEDAQADITEKWNEFMREGKEHLDSLFVTYQNASEEEKDKAKKAYEDALKSYTLRNDRYKQTIDTVTDRLAKVNEIAIHYSNDKLANIYAVNYNQTVDGVKSLGISFNLVDETTVRRMIKDGDIKLPYKKLDKIKDKLWNTKQLNSSVLQGILQGESMADIASRILPIVNSNEAASIRNARTMVTGAENRGRADRYEDLEDEGAVIKKVWIATEDDRTRAWHMSMDGQEVDIDEPFVDGLGNELDYPGDPSAEPETVYNCRCSMKSHIIGFRRSDGTISMIGDRDGNKD